MPGARAATHDPASGGEPQAGGANRFLYLLMLHLLSHMLFDRRARPKITNYTMRAIGRLEDFAAHLALVSWVRQKGWRGHSPRPPIR